MITTIVNIINKQYTITQGLLYKWKI
jgi:hypothetical protein